MELKICENNFVTVFYNVSNSFKKQFYDGKCKNFKNVQG